MENKKRKYLLTIIRSCVVIVFLAWVISSISREGNWDSFAQYFQQINIWIFAATICIFTAGHIIVALRWWVLLRTQSVFISLWAAIKLYFLGWFYNNFMPSSIGGDVVRAWYVTKHTEKRFEAALSVFVDRIIGLLSTFVIAFFFYMLLLPGTLKQVLAEANLKQQTKPGFFTTHREIVITITLISLLVLSGLALTRKGRLLLSKIYGKLRHLLIKLKQAAVIYCNKPLAIASVFCLTVVMQLMVITGFWILGKSMGIDVSVRYYYVFFSLAWVVGVIPVSIGGFGVVEFFLVLMFTRIAGIEEPAAMAIALSQRAVWMLTSLPGAVIHLMGAHLPGEPDGLHVPQDFSVDCEDKVN